MVWGAAGNYPDMTSGLLTVDSHNRPTYANRLTMHPNVTDAQRPYLFAARCESNSVHTCNGRDFVAEVAARQRVDVRTLSDAARLQSAMQNPSAWSWPRVNDEPAAGGTIVWGESCMNRAHFDCIGFINYCIWRVADAIHAPSIRQIAPWWQHVFGGARHRSTCRIRPAT